LSFGTWLKKPEYSISEFAGHSLPSLQYYRHREEKGGKN